jgi:hypothetical protein
VLARRREEGMSLFFNSVIPASIDNAVMEDSMSPEA